ncbi:6-hydroxymethylpterin diphosphokinase MptE-like protein [Peptostreptococcaceae bacterium AGR-M142]
MQIKEDKKGNITMEIKNLDKIFYLHSKYDVYKEAKRFSNNFLEKSKDINIIYGFGLGYHIKEVLKILKENQKLYILELRKDIFEFAKSKLDLEDILNDKRVKLIVKDNYQDLILEFQKIDLKKSSEFFSHEPSINAIEEKNIKFKEILDELKVLKKIKVDKVQLKNIETNIELNKKLNDKKASMFFGEFKNIPGIVISAGPSLDYSIKELKNFKNKSVLFSVGRSLRAFTDLEFDPDMFMIVDPNPITKTHIKGYENSNIPFYYLISACNETVKSYKGTRFYFYNEEEKKDKNAIKVKSSVSTGVLSMLIKMGCSPIIFVGQDLGFYEGCQHSKAVIYDGYDFNNKLNTNYKYDKIKNVFGDYIYTNKGYKSMKLFIENIIRENKHIEFINSSYKGAHIEGTKYMDIKEVYEKYIKDKSFNIDEKIKNIINNN